MNVKIQYELRNQKITDPACIVQMQALNDTRMNPGSKGRNYLLNGFSIKLHGYNPIKNKSKIH